MFAELRTRLLIALSLTCALAPSVACKKAEDDATAVDNESPKKKPRVIPDPPKKKPKKKEWSVKSSGGGSCPHAVFCTTSPEQPEGTDAGGPYSATCGNSAGVPESIAGFKTRASFHLEQTQKARDEDDEGDACCYTYRTGPCGKGRPLRAEGELVLASEQFREGWCDRVAIELGSLDGRELKALVGHLRHVAILEHASVAAFATVSLELLALGAPSELVEGAHRAALDEIRHARMCWSILAAIEGTPRGPGVMTLPAMPAIDAERILVATVVEGCVGETFGSLLFHEAARRCTVPALAAFYRTVAAEEEEHAALAFRIVQFLTADDPSRIERAIAAAERADRSGTDSPNLPHLGILDQRTQREVFERGYREVVQPVLASLRASAGGRERALRTQELSGNPPD